MQHYTLIQRPVTILVWVHTVNDRQFGGSESKYT